MVLTGAEVVYGRHRAGREEEGLGQRLGGGLLSGHVEDLGGGHPDRGVDRGQHVPARRLELGGHGRRRRQAPPRRWRPAPAPWTGRCGGGGGRGMGRGGGGRHGRAGGRTGGRGRMDHPQHQYRGHHEGHQHDARLDHRKAAAAPSGTRRGSFCSVGGLGHWVPACQPGGVKQAFPIGPRSEPGGRSHHALGDFRMGRTMIGAPGRSRHRAGVAQLVAQTTCNRQVVGSIPTAGSNNPSSERCLCCRWSAGLRRDLRGIDSES